MTKLISTYEPLTLKDLDRLSEMLISKNIEDAKLAFGVLNSRDWDREPLRTTAGLIVRDVVSPNGFINLTLLYDYTDFRANVWGEEPKHKDYEELYHILGKPPAAFSTVSVKQYTIDLTQVSTKAYTKQEKPSIPSYFYKRINIPKNLRDSITRIK